MAVTKSEIKKKGKEMAERLSHRALVKVLKVCEDMKKNDPKFKYRATYLSEIMKEAISIQKQAS